MGIILICDSFFQWSPQRFKNPLVICGLVLMLIGLVAAFGATKWSDIIEKYRKKKQKNTLNLTQNDSEIADDLKTETDITLKDDADIAEVKTATDVKTSEAEVVDNIGNKDAVDAELNSLDASLDADKAIPLAGETAQSVVSADALSDQQKELLEQFEKGEEESKANVSRKKSRYKFDTVETIFKLGGYLFVVIGALMAVLGA